MMGECVTLLPSDSPHVLHQVTKNVVFLQEHASAVLMKIRLGDYSSVQLPIPQVKAV